MDDSLALRGAVEAAFRPGCGSTSVGAELELHVLDPVTGLPLPGVQVTALLPTGLEHAATVSFEPGGQLELSFHPQRSAGVLATAVASWLRRLAGALEGRAVVSCSGTHPTLGAAQVPLARATPRYLAMQRSFDRVGADGRRMMRTTASLQVCVDLLPGKAGREQWLVANLASPVLAAAFPHSPQLDGSPSGLPGARSRIWCGVDLERTAYDGRHLDAADPVGAYHAFAAGARRLEVEEAADPAYHLTTLFPPVRPRGGYLELRALDAQPLERIAPVLRTVETLMYDARVRAAALELLAPHQEDLGLAWQGAAAGVHPAVADLLALTGTEPREPALNDPEPWRKAS